MLELALSESREPVYLKDIARKEAISEKYLSLIIIPIKSAGLVTSTRGAHGGYTLAKPPSKITLREIVELLEGDTSLVECVKNSSSCPRADTCASRDLWSLVSEKIGLTLASITLEDLARMSRDKSEGAHRDHS